MTVFILILLTLGFGVYFLRERTLNTLKKSVAKAGGQLVSLEREWNFYSGMVTEYTLIYYDKKGRLHRSTVLANFFLYRIDADKIIEKEAELNFPAAPDTKQEAAPFIIKKIVSNKGLVTIEQQSHDMEIGDKVSIAGQPAPDGKYKLGFLHYIYVKDGKIG